MVMLPQPHNIVSKHYYYVIRRSLSGLDCIFSVTKMQLILDKDGFGFLITSIVLFWCRLQFSEPSHKLRPTACT
jgi:hypothetical protein